MMLRLVLSFNKDNKNMSRISDHGNKIVNYMKPTETKIEMLLQKYTLDNTDENVVFLVGKSSPNCLDERGK